MIDPYGVIILLCAGGLAGFLSGFFGAGGGLIVVPVLIVALEGSGVSSLVATHCAFGTSLCVVVVASFTPAYRAFRSGRLPGRDLAFAGAAGVVAAVVGSMIAGGLEGKTLRLLMGFATLIPALQFLARETTPKRDLETPVTQPALVGSGLFMGFVSSLTGIEGSVTGIPMMYRFMSFPLKESVDASHVTTVLAAFTASVVYAVMGSGNTLLPPYTVGYVAHLAAILLLAGTIPLNAWGASMARKARPGRSRKYYGVILLAIAVKMIFF